MQVLHSLVAHYVGANSGQREVTLPIIAIKEDGTMLVLFQNRLQPVFTAIPGMNIELVEIVEPAQAKEQYYAKNKKKAVEVKPATPSE